MEPIHGTDILLSLKIGASFIPVLCAIDMTYNCSQETVLATSASTGKWRQKRLRGLSEWSVSLSGLTKIDNTDGQVSFFYLLQENIRGSEQIIQIMFEDNLGNTQILEGTVIIPELSINGNVSSFADVSVLFEGTGAVEITEAVSGGGESGESDTCDDLMSDTWLVVAGNNNITGAGQEGRSFAGHEIIEVDREGLQHDYTDGTPGNRQYGYDGNLVTFDPANPFNEGETIFVIWKQ